MKLHQTIFFSQFVAAVSGTVLVVASYAFVSTRSRSPRAERSCI